MRQTIGLMAACAALLAGCTNEVGEGLGIDTPIQVTASVEGVLTTRTDNSTESLSTFGLSIKDGQSYDGNYAGENILAKSENGTWTLDKTVLYKGSGQSYFAYAPYNADMAKGATTYAFSVQADQSVEGAMQASDLLHAAGEVESAKLDITLAHKLSKLTVKLQTEADFSGTISYEHLYLRGCLPTTSLNLTDGTLGEAKGEAIVTEMWHNEESGTYECILVPQTVKYSVVIDAKVNNSPKSYVYTPANAYEFKSNNSYTLTLTIKEQDVQSEINSIKVAGWGDGKDIALEDGEAVEPYTIEADGSYTVRTAEGLRAWRKAARDDDDINCTLAADIDMTNTNWQRIDCSGTFDGNGYTITGLKDCLIDWNTGTVRNLTLVNPNVNTSYHRAGAVASENFGTIENCHVVGGSVKSSWEDTGGIVGNNEDGNILACSSTATVTGAGATGGIVGYNAGSVLACYATGSVTSSGGYIGAIVGRRDGGTQTACYWSGDAEKGVGSGLDTTTKVAGDVTWETAMDAMNDALSGTGYQWEENPDESSKATRPLIITNE